MEQFFVGMEWQDLLGIAFTFILGFFPGVNVFNWIKSKSKLEGVQANILVQVLSIGFTALAMFATGQLGLEGFEFTFSNILAYASALYASSQVAYSWLKRDMPSVVKPPQIGRMPV